MIGALASLAYAASLVGVIVVVCVELSRHGFSGMFVPGPYGGAAPVAAADVAAFVIGTIAYAVVATVVWMRWRRAKRDWNAFDRIWTALVARLRAESGGDLDAAALAAELGIERADAMALLAKLPNLSRNEGYRVAPCTARLAPEIAGEAEMDDHYDPSTGETKEGSRAPLRRFPPP